jgi:hypothetical protein
MPVQNSTEFVTPPDKLIPHIRFVFSSTPSIEMTSLCVVSLLTLKTTSFVGSWCSV